MAAETEPLEHSIQDLMPHLVVEWAVGVVAWSSLLLRQGGASFLSPVECVPGPAIESGEVVQSELVEEVGKTSDVVGRVSPLQPPDLRCKGLQQDFGQVPGARRL